MVKNGVYIVILLLLIFVYMNFFYVMCLFGIDFGIGFVKFVMFDVDGVEWVVVSEFYVLLLL